VAFLIEEHKDRIIIAHSLSDINDCLGVLAIPKGCILKRKKIK
jgi:ABC-type multidrug transport system fused ATPase/permease subunit